MMLSLLDLPLHSLVVARVLTTFRNVAAIRITLFWYDGQLSICTRGRAWVTCRFITSASAKSWDF